MHDAWFFLGVFVFIFLIWIATGGPTHPIAFSGPVLAEPQELGGGDYLSLPRAPFRIGSTYISLPGSSNGQGGQGDTGSSVSSLGGGLFGPSSPYRGSVSMVQYVSGAGSSNVGNEYLEIFIPQNASAPVNISGWKLVSEATGNTAVLPKGNEIPTAGIVNPVQDIVLSQGVRATVISGRSPIGVSFRENKCIGYLSTFQQFSPPLPQNCPMPSDELVSFYGPYYIRDAACIDYVNTLSRCQTVTSPPSTVSKACQNFVVKYLNYNGCVSAHVDDTNFLGDTWRIYLGRFGAMWRARYEVVKLWDSTGKTVDAFSY